ncbi:MAG: hypothetical protein AB7O62_16290 [Pirellulales bacterium]
MKMQIAGVVWLALGCMVPPNWAQAQCETSTYRLVYETVYDEREVTAYRMEYETVYDEQQVTAMRPVYETEMRQRRYKVAKPVCETTEREEHYSVLKPVYETQMRDASYDRVRTVCETAEREERYQVSKPVWETSEREERFTVRRAVTETAEREVNRTVMEPVTTYRPVQVDRGGYVCQQVCRPGATVNRLRWQSGKCIVDPATGHTAYQRGGLYWVPFTAPSQIEVQKVWQPNIVEEQVPQTSYVARVETYKVPYQVQRYVDEEMVRTVPVRTCRMQTEEFVRRVPYTVQKQVVERVEQQVPVQVCRYERQEMVRKVPVTVQRMVYEERVEETPVQVCRYEQVVQTQRTPRTVCKKVPVSYTCRVPRLVVKRVPVDECTPVFGDVYGGEATTIEAAPIDSAQPETTYYGETRKIIVDEGTPATIIEKKPTPAKKLEPEPAPESTRSALDEDASGDINVGPVDEDAEPSRSTYERSDNEETVRPRRRLTKF